MSLVQKTSGGGGKITSVSIIRLLAMLSIVSCHFFQYYGSKWAIWLNVGVQIFFFISGYLYGTKNIPHVIPWIKKQSYKILLPYYTVLLFTYLVYAILCPNHLNVINGFGMLFTLGTIDGLNHLWFVGTILFCYIITPYLQTIRDYIDQKDTFRSLFSLLFIGTIYVVISVAIESHWRAGFVSCYILGYFMAYYEKKVKRKFWEKCAIASIFPCIIANGVFCYLVYGVGIELKGRLAHINDFQHLFLGLMIWTSLMVLFRKSQPSKILEWSDKNSYEIYLIHHLFILSPITLMGITNYAGLNITITILTILIFTFILSRLNRVIRNNVRHLFRHTNL